MHLRRLELWLCVVALALLAGCGSPGVPLPPSLELAQPVTDLRASRKGNKVYLTWSIPVHNTDHQNLRHGGTAEVCREIAAKTKKTCDTPVTRIAFQQPSRNKTPANTVNYTDELPTNLQAPPTSDLVYAVRILNPYGRSAGLSNEVRVSAAPTQAAPTDFQAQLTAEGVELTWTAVPTLQTAGLRLLYRVYRREHGSNAEAIAGEVAVENQTNPSLLDRSFEWEKTYDYRATVVTIVSAASGNEEQVEGDDTPPIEIVAHDVFPPATPVGLQAVFSGPGQKLFVDLIWTPDTEVDLAGYNVFRREEGGEQTKLNSDLVKSPTFRDSAVEPGRRYAYSISAVDGRGNESAHSEEASETVPAQ